MMLPKKRRRSALIITTRLPLQFFLVLAIVLFSTILFQSMNITSTSTVVDVGNAMNKVPDDGPVAKRRGGRKRSERRVAVQHTSLAQPAEEVQRSENSIAAKFTAKSSHKSPYRKQRQQPQRIVMLVGPHKSATTSVQAYLIKLSKQDILNQYGWSWAGNDKSKGFAEASRFLLLGDTIKGKGMTELLKHSAQNDWNEGNSLVVAAEFLDYVAAQDEKEAHTSVKRLWDWLPKTMNDGSSITTARDASPRRTSTITSTNNVEAVVMYRSPRSAHLISIWKQQVLFRKAIDVDPWRKTLDKEHRIRKNIPQTPPSLAEWLCNGMWKEIMRYNVPTILAAQLNPFGVAHFYHVYGGANVKMVDMAGVKNGDIPSAVVCDVLKLPCTEDGKLDSSVPVVSRARNVKNEPTALGLTDADLKEAEEIIRDMDCYYYCQMGEKLNVLHGKDEIFADGKSSWESCCRRNTRNGGNVDGHRTSQRLRDLGCRAYEKLDANRA